MRTARFAAAAFVFVFVAVWGQMGAARAETCPDVPDDEVALRRSLAKEWFAKAEEAEAGGDRQGAVRRYACSLNLAPHPSTAYNLGAVAEKSGDLAMAIDGFRTYLKLAIEATDRPAIEARIVALEAKISELRKIGPKPSDPAPTGTVAPPAPASAAPLSQPTVVAPPAPAPEGPGRRIAAWVTGGGSAAALGTGVVLNYLARSKMDQCRSQFNAQVPRALDRCDEAKPLAYTSYVLFGVAGAAAVASTVLLLWGTDRATESTSTSTDVALVPGIVPGGASLLATGRF